MRAAVVSAALRGWAQYRLDTAVSCDRRLGACLPPIGGDDLAAVFELLAELATAV